VTESSEPRPAPAFELHPHQVAAVLALPEVAARLRAEGLDASDMGWPEPPPHVDRLWEIVLEQRPEWRPWYEWARERAARAHARARGVAPASRPFVEPSEG